MDDALTPDDFEALRRASVGQRLLQAARLLDVTALAQIRAVPGAPQIRPAHTRLFPYILHKGARVTSIARELGISKQAVAALVTDLVGWGLVEQVPDPTDGRARLVRWTAEGRASMQYGLQVLDQLMAQVEAKVGAQTMAHLANGLAAMIELLETGPHNR